MEKHEGWPKFHVGNATRIYRIDVYDENGSVLAAVELPTYSADPEVGVRWAGNAASIDPHQSLLSGAAWSGSHAEGACLERVSAGVVLNLRTQEQRTRLLVQLDGECLGEQTARAALVAAGRDVRNTTFRIHSTGQPAVVGADSGGSVVYVPVDELGGYFASRAQAAYIGAAFQYGAARTFTLDEEWIGSFALGTERIAAQLPGTATAQHGSNTTQCPCFFRAGEVPGSWTFRASGAFDAAPYLLLADIEWA